MKSYDRTVTSRVKRIVNAALVAAVAILASIQLAPLAASAVRPSSFGDFGLNMDCGGGGATWRVLQVDAGSPAYSAGLAVGDKIDPPPNGRPRYVVCGSAQPTIGERVTFVVHHGNMHRQVTLVANPMQPLGTTDLVSQAAIWVTSLVFLIVGAFLALVRPSKMTWGFYLLAACVAWSFPSGPPPPIPTKLLLAYDVLWYVFLTPAGIVGALWFSLRFPSTNVTGWRKKVDALVPVFFLALAVFQPYCLSLPDLVGFVRPEALLWLQSIWNVNVTVVEALALASLAGMYRGSVGLERQRVKWVVFGFGCLAIGVTIGMLANEGVFKYVPWLTPAGQSLGIAFPLSVAYAVIKHRVIDVRFVLSRALVFGALAVLVGALIVSLDWLLSTRFTNSRLQTAVYAGIALLVGLALNPARRFIGKTIDSVFFHQWHSVQERAQAVGDAIARAASRSDLCEPLTAGIAQAFSVASAALFERARDGGFVRIASKGWPSGTLWHILADQALARHSLGRQTVTAIDALPWREPNVPAGIARPTFMVKVEAGKVVPAILLVGAHEDGTGFDPDELRAIRRLCADAALIYGRQPTIDLQRDSLVHSASAMRLPANG